MKIKTKEFPITDEIILCAVMRKAGFTSPSIEQWHFEYGNSYWAYYLNKKLICFELINYKTYQIIIKKI